MRNIIIGAIVVFALLYLLQNTYQFVSMGDGPAVIRCNNFTGDCVWFRIEKLPNDSAGN